MYYYHMTSMGNLKSIREKGLIPKNKSNSKLIGDEKVKFFSQRDSKGQSLYL